MSNVPLYQELARRIGLQRMRDAIQRLRYGNEQIGTNVTTFWLRGPLAINSVEQTRFLSALARQSLPFPRKAQEQVAEITRVDSGPGWSLHAKTGWQNAPGPGVGWWVGWVRKGGPDHLLCPQPDHGRLRRTPQTRAAGAPEPASPWDPAGSTQGSRNGTMKPPS